ncbi:Cyclopentanol dehydrogenase [Peribacillus sp. Bi96]|nr:Cyclopentanol dehydrogenase [Peribacillus sp. Bi96]
MGSLDGKVANITGAPMGQGAAEAKLVAKEGANVVATDVQEVVLQQLVDEINDKGGDAIAIKHNVASEEEWKGVVNKAI